MKGRGLHFDEETFDAASKKKIENGIEDFNEIKRANEMER